MESNAARSIRPAWVPPPSIPIAYVSQACMAPSHHGFASDYYIAAAHRHRYWRQLQLVVHPPLLITRGRPCLVLKFLFKLLIFFIPSKLLYTHKLLTFTPHRSNFNQTKHTCRRVSSWMHTDAVAG